MPFNVSQAPTPSVFVCSGELNKAIRKYCVQLSRRRDVYRSGTDHIEQRVEDVFATFNKTFDTAIWYMYSCLHI